MHPTFYLPVAQNRLTTLSLVIRTAGDPEPLFPSLREAVRRVDPEAPITSLASATSLATRAAREERFRAILIATFAVIATLLASAGAFGVTTRRVQLRKREMGIRMALGAAETGLVGSVVVRSMVPAMVGIGAGLTVALGTSHILASLLFGIESWDPLTYLGAGCTLALVSLLASTLPAGRISRMTPMQVLREE